MSDQYLRKVGLVVTAGSSGLDLSQMQIIFSVQAMDVDRPSTASIKVLNLSDATARSIAKEFQAVSLQAGYEQGNFGQIFSGSIMQVRRGRYNAKDTYVEILAAAGDKAFNLSVVSKALAAGSSRLDRANAVIGQMAEDDATITKGSLPSSLGTGGILPRGKVLFGLGRDHLTDVANSGDVSWSIDQNGVLNMIPIQGYLPGEALVINSRTGMIQNPEATNDGIKVRMLLNPLVKLGTRLQIDEASINATTILNQGFPAYSDISFVASTANDGVYKVLVAEYNGDTRGPDWYTEVTCLSLDQSAAADSSVIGGG